ncbi:MAG: hypothetical protein L6R36_006880, partial [Xanthoria steineri]
TRRLAVLARERDGEHGSTTRPGATGSIPGEYISSAYLGTTGSIQDERSEQEDLIIYIDLELDALIAPG